MGEASAEAAHLNGPKTCNARQGSRLDKWVIAQDKRFCIKIRFSGGGNMYKESKTTKSINRCRPSLASGFSIVRGGQLFTVKCIVVLVITIVGCFGCAPGEFGGSASKAAVKHLTNCSIQYGASNCQTLSTFCRQHYSEWTTSNGEYGCSCCDN